MLARWNLQLPRRDGAILTIRIGAPDCQAEVEMQTMREELQRLGARVRGGSVGHPCLKFANQGREG